MIKKYHLRLLVYDYMTGYHNYVFGYFAGCRDAGCNLRGAGHGLWGAGCEMLSLILELQTCQLGLCFAHFVLIH